MGIVLHDQIRTTIVEDLSTMGTATRKHYSVDQKVQIVLELLKEEKTLSQLAAAYGIHHSQITRWKKRGHGQSFRRLFPGPRWEGS